MYYQAVHTRCKNGIKDFESLKTIDSDGYKVFDYSRDILSKGIVDTAVLSKVIAEETPHDRERIPDDAYIYLRPDEGGKILVSFFQNYQTSRSFHVHQALIGQFDDIYPAELFNNDALWKAKKLGEEYYLTAVPSGMPVIENIDNIVEAFPEDELKSFIESGRLGLFGQVVSYIIEQYSLADKDRKYVVIKAASERDIELWIAAIEMAFSPRMASGLSFATRMNKIQNSNRYMVNSAGVMQSRMDIQNPDLSLRCFAMIAGIVEADRDYNMIRPMANLPYVLLDDKARSFSAGKEVARPYFNLVTSYTDSHKYFCREFLQMVNINTPSKDIYELYNIYISMQEQVISADNYLKLLDRLFKYRLSFTNALNEIYKKAKIIANDSLEKDFFAAFGIIRYITKIAPIVGDTSPYDEFPGEISKKFINELFFSQDFAKTEKIWSLIKDSSFYDYVSLQINNALSSEEYILKYSGSSPEKEAFIYSIYNDTNNKDNELIKKILKICLTNCLKTANTAVAQNLVDISMRKSDKTSSEFWSAFIPDCDDKLLEFLFANTSLLKQLGVVNSADNVISFSEKLAELKKYNTVSTIFSIFVGSAAPSSVVERFINSLSRLSYHDMINIKSILLTADRKCSSLDSELKGIAASIQNVKPPKLCCSNSAHIMAYHVLSSRSAEIAKYIKPYRDQGFPSADNQKYITSLVSAILRNNYSESDFKLISEMIVSAPWNYYFSFISALLPIASKKPRQLEIAINAAERSTPEIRNVCYSSLINALGNSGMSEKALERLGDIFSNVSDKTYYVSALSTLIEQKEKKRKNIFGIFKKKN